MYVCVYIYICIWCIYVYLRHMRYFKHFSCRTWDFINVSSTKKRDPNKDKTTKHREIPEHLDLGIWVKSWGTSKVGWLVDLEYQNIFKKKQNDKIFGTLTSKSRWFLRQALRAKLWQLLVAVSWQKSLATSGARLVKTWGVKPLKREKRPEIETDLDLVLTLLIIGVPKFDPQPFCHATWWFHGIWILSKTILNHPQFQHKQVLQTVPKWVVYCCFFPTFNLFSI